MWALLLKPKNIMIIVLILAFLGLIGSTYYFKKQVDILKLKVVDLQKQVTTLEQVKKDLEKNNKALQQQLDNYMKIGKTADDIQKRIDNLKKNCPQTIKVPVPKPSETKTEVKTEVKVEPGKAEVKTEVKTETKQPEVVDYEWGGFEYEKEAIGIYNDVVKWFNSADVSLLHSENDSSPPRAYCMSLSGQTIIEGDGFNENFSLTDELQCDT